jgi:FMN phosphatase YigB (HAD superfamily)
LFSDKGVLPNRKQLEKIYLDLEIIFLEDLPKTMYEIDVLVKCFEDLKLKGYSLNISSNTAYIKGKTLIKVLESLQIKKYFDFFIFSDEIKSSKPSTKFFDCLIYNCTKLGVSRNNITHIGDSLEADISGAQQSKIKSFYVNKNEFKLVDFLNEL